MTRAHSQDRSVRRVLIVHNYPTPYRLPLFARLGTLWEVEVWFCSPGSRARKWATESGDVDGAKVVVLPHFNIGQLLVNYTAIWRSALSRADAVVICESPDNVLTSIVTALACHFRRVPVVLWTEHVLGSTEFQRKRVVSGAILRRAYRSARKLILANADVVVCMSGNASVREIARLSSSLPPVIMGTQVMPQKLLPSRRGRGRASAINSHFLFLGYFRPEKDIRVLIEAFKDACTSDDVLTIAGDGPLRSQLEDAVAGCPNITLLNYVIGEQKGSLLESVDALVLPSTYEPWGLVVNESLYFGTPVIACEDIGAAELIEDGKNGLLFKWDPDGAGLRMTLKRFCDDSDLRKHLSEGAGSMSSEVLCDVAVGTAALEQAIASLEPTSDAVST